MVIYERTYENYCHILRFKRPKHNKFNNVSVYQQVMNKILKIPNPKRNNFAEYIN